MVIRLQSTQNQAQELYTEKASLYNRVFIGFLKWGKQLEAFFKESNYLHSNMKVLDAGCGTGIVTKTLYKLAQEKGFDGLQFHAFDLTENMLEIFREWIDEQGVSNIELTQADVLKMDTLPPEWREYDLIVTSAMLEYLPKAEVKNALVNLKNRLKSDGVLLVFITNRNLLTRWFAGKWWKANLYSKKEIRRMLENGELGKIEFKKFPGWWSSFILVFEAEK